MANADPAKAHAVPTVSCPEASGRSGWLMRSVSRSTMSFSALPPAVKAAAAAAARTSGRARSPHAADPTPTTPPMPTPTADMTQLRGRARRRSPATAARTVGVVITVAVRGIENGIVGRPIGTIIPGPFHLFHNPPVGLGILSRRHAASGSKCGGFQWTMAGRRASAS